ncbi:hypothetical protein Pfo_006670 [Paulownia fortunei]|nr:hypothetical protein Pfo_006670 [Paulownia fortunei]
MGKREGYQGPVNHRAVRGKRGWQCVQNSRKQFSQWVWMPAVPSWEKEFCYKIGSFTWENFLEAKKKTRFAEKIIDWNDSAAEAAFHNAKNLFFARINGLSTADYSLPGPDLYIDEIDWDDHELNPEVLHEILELARVESDGDEEDHYRIPVQDMKPTGWEDDVEVYFSSGKVLTGLIVGS